MSYDPPFSEHDAAAFRRLLDDALPAPPPGHPVVVTVAITARDGLQRTSTAVLPSGVDTSTLVQTGLGALSGALAQLGVLVHFAPPAPPGAGNADPTCRRCR